LSHRGGATGPTDLALPLIGTSGGGGNGTGGGGTVDRGGGLDPDAATGSLFFTGAPQFGHAAAELLTSCPHSKHLVSPCNSRLAAVKQH